MLYSCFLNTATNLKKRLLSGGGVTYLPAKPLYIKGLGGRLSIPRLKANRQGMVILWRNG
jgi:hypothetical protein